MRFAAAAAGLGAIAIGVTGCLSIKEETAFQRAPGVVSLKVSVCASDYDSNTYASCNASNVQEQDNLRIDSDDSSPALGQLFAAYRVPDGSTGPASFLSDAQDVSFSRSASYTQQISASFPPPSGFHWEGYVSTAKTFNPADASTRETAFHPEFALAPSAAGAPFAGPFKWRVVAGFRDLASAGDAGTPVDCGNLLTFCADSPPNATIASDLIAPVSDFGVLPGAGATAGQGQTATVSFTVRDIDSGGLGAQPLAVTATTTVPGAHASPSVANLTIPAGGTVPVSVAVPVPAGTPLGSYTATLTTSTGSPAVVRSNSATIQVVDNLAPAIQIGTPADGASFVRGQKVLADYSCSDELNGSGVRSCVGPVADHAAIDTQDLGTRTFTVTASDNTGNLSRVTHTYTVVPTPITVTLSFNFARGRGFTLLTKLDVRNVPRGSRVKAACAIKHKKCPGAAGHAFTKSNAGGTVNLGKHFAHVRLKAGSEITVTVTKPGFIGAIKILAIRSGRAPTVLDRCLPPGSSKPQLHCGGRG